MHTHKCNAAYHRINTFGNFREKCCFSVPVEKRQAKEKWLSPEPSKSAQSGVKSPAKTLGTSTREPWSSQGRGRRWKSLYSQIRPNLLNGPPVRLPPDSGSSERRMSGGGGMGGRGGGGRLCGLVIPSLGNKLLPEQQSQLTQSWKVSVGSKMRQFKMVKYTNTNVYTN